MANKSYTQDGIRYFICKSCGLKTAESVYRWRRKKQSEKNICPICLEERSIRAQTARERAEDFGHWT